MKNKEDEFKKYLEKTKNIEANADEQVLKFIFDFVTFRIKINKLIKFKFNVKNKIENSKPSSNNINFKPLLAAFKVKNISILYNTTGEDLSSPLFKAFFTLIVPLLKELSQEKIGSFYYRHRLAAKSEIKIYGNISLSLVRLIAILINKRKTIWKKKSSTKKSETI